MIGLRDLLGTLKATMGLVERTGIDIDKEIKEDLNHELLSYNPDLSLIKITEPTIIQPSLYIEKGLTEEEIFNKVVEILIDVFASFYVKAFKTMVGVYDMSVVVAVDVLRSNGAMNYSLESEEDFKNSIRKDMLELAKPLCLEIQQNIASIEREKTDVEFIPKTVLKSVDIKLKTEKGGKKTEIEIPVTFRTRMFFTSSKNLVNVVRTKGKVPTLFEAIDETKAGLSDISDLVFCNTMVKDYEKARMEDTDNIIKDVNKRVMNARIKSIGSLYSTKANNVSTNYAILLCSKSTITTILKELHKKSLENEKDKSKVMDAFKSLIICSLDLDYENMEMYIDGIEGMTETDFKTLSKSSTGNSGDMERIFKNVLENKPPMI